MTYTEAQRRAAEPTNRAKYYDRGLIMLALELQGPRGPRKVSALLDCGAEDNFMDQLLAAELGVKPDRSEQPRFQALNGQQLAVLGKTEARYRVQDNTGGHRGCLDQFVVGGIHGFDVVLGMPWL